jgi:uncharacterized protein (DUF488 family)
MPIIYTVGHSTRSLKQLVSILAAAGVKELIDVRTVPRSARHPHFRDSALARELPHHGMIYSYERALGGFRRPRPDSSNAGWQHAAFRGYADHMADEEFQAALERMEGRARDHAVCLMCAEAQWRRCHRRLIADALLVRGWRVLHLGLQEKPVHHELTPFAVVRDRAIAYPPLQAELSGMRSA